VRHHGNFDEDPYGAELPDLDAAIDEAIKAEREILAEKVASADIVDGDQFEITTDEGDILRDVIFLSALRLNEE
jgi:hypothetical protein